MHFLTYTQKVTLGGKLPTPLDIMVEDVMVPENIEIGDRLVIYNCGAYGFNHSLTNFALHNYPAEVAYSDGKMQLIRETGKIEDFFLLFLLRTICIRPTTPITQAE